MFGFFRKKKDPKEALLEQYKKLLEQSYALSTSNRVKSDEKRTEAEALLKKIEDLEK